MKLITILALTTIDESNYSVKIPKLDDLLLKDIIKNKLKQCKSLNKAFIAISSIYDSEVKDFAGVIRSFNNVEEVNIRDFKGKLKDLGFDLKKHKVIYFETPVIKKDNGLMTPDFYDIDGRVFRFGFFGIFFIFLYMI